MTDEPFSKVSTHRLNVVNLAVKGLKTRSIESLKPCTAISVFFNDVGP